MQAHPLIVHRVGNIRDTASVGYGCPMQSIVCDQFICISFPNISVHGRQAGNAPFGNKLVNPYRSALGANISKQFGEILCVGTAECSVVDQVTYILS